jgi:hypothetical protein
MDEILRHQLARWQTAIDADREGELIVLDGDPFKLYYSWAERQLSLIPETSWLATVQRFRGHFARGEYGLADLVLYADPPLEELIWRKDDATLNRRSRSNLGSQPRLADARLPPHQNQPRAANAHRRPGAANAWASLTRPVNGNAPRSASPGGKAGDSLGDGRGCHTPPRPPPDASDP